ncbi:MAG TPA: cytochrome c [Terriglobia bacterium]|nr:cytochrome c [Terriglobia bacterium]
MIIGWILALLAALQAGPTERQRVDSQAANRGRLVYTENCINCHGSSAKGTDNGPDLIRSAVVLRDRLGNAIGPAINAGGPHKAKLSSAQITDLSHFLHQRVEAIASNRNARGTIDVLTGNVEAGRAYFNGEGKCASCHSPTGDLKGVATRIRTAMDLQQRFLFPSLRAPQRVEVTVAPPNAPPVTGALVRIDNFNVSLRDATGEYRSFRRAPDVRVEVRDPLEAHHALLDTITDTNIHDVVTYLETLK